MRRFAGILLALFYLSVGTGALQFVHEWGHAIEDAHEAAIARAAGKPVEASDHDADCEICKEIHLLMIGFDVWVPLLILLGLFVAYLTQLPMTPVCRTAPVRIDCRGPPISRSRQHLAM